MFHDTWPMSSIAISVSLAAMRIAQSGDVRAPQALGFWTIQITLNALWSPVFFGLRRMRSALIVVALLWVAVAVTMVAFVRIDWLAGLLFLPYIAWVSTATALNAAVLRRNPEMA